MTHLLKFYAVKIWIVPAICLAILLLPQSGFSFYKKIKLAVVDFSLQGEGFDNQDMGKIVAEWFITALVKEGRFDVVERSMLDKIIAEQKLSMSGVIDVESATAIGRLLGVKVLITGSVIRLQNTTEVNARIIDVESASIIVAENIRSQSADKLRSLIFKITDKIIKAFPLEGYIVSRSGETVAIDRGRMTGAKNGMNFLVYKEGKVLKHPKTGEVLDVEHIKTGKIVVTSVREKIAAAKLVEEYAPHVIEAGHMVKSLPSASDFTSRDGRRALSSPSPLPPRVAVIQRSAPPKRKASAGVGQLRGEQLKYAQMLRSDSSRDKVYAAKKISRGKITNTALLDIVEKELLAGYKTDVDRNYIDVLSWYCKVLGGSGNKKYVGTLEKVAKSGSTRKLKKYAEKSLGLLE